MTCCVAINLGKALLVAALRFPLLIQWTCHLLLRFFYWSRSSKGQWKELPNPGYETW